MTGQNTARPPHSEQNGVLAVINHVSGRAPLPPHGTGGADLPPHVIEVGPNYLPRRKRNRTVIADCRALDLGSGAPPRRVLGGSLGLRAGAAVLLQFGLTLRGKFGDYALRQGSKVSPRIGLLPHANQHEVRDVRFVGKVFQSNGEVHERGY